MGDHLGRQIAGRLYTHYLEGGGCDKGDGGSSHGLP
jgi:hypothetical protein